MGMKKPEAVSAPSRVFRALGDDTRRQILSLLVTESLSVARIAESFDMSRPAVSKHLRLLRQAGLVSPRPSGRQRLYELRPERLAEAGAWIEALGAGASGPDAGGRRRRAPEPGGEAPARRVGGESAVRRRAGRRRPGPEEPEPRPSARDWRVW